jgi:hypothetical protein
MTLPTVHLNGTSGPDLLEQITKAREGVEAAIARLQDAAPNGRDYYPQGPDAYPAARAEHDARLQRLTTVERELQDIELHLFDAVELRRKR